MSGARSTSAAERRRFLAPLALAQFICSFAGSNMNVMINDITEDLDTTVTGVQAAITLHPQLAPPFLVRQMSDEFMPPAVLPRSALKRAIDGCRGPRRRGCVVRVGRTTGAP